MVKVVLMLIYTPQGLYCPEGNFHIDPSGRVENALITHAHSDHARRGSKRYITVRSGAGLLKARIGKNISLSTYEYRESFFMGPIKVSFHPAGHILGSSQIRLELQNQVWVVSGDYKRETDPTCEEFEIVPCDVFITEATFGTPSFRWNKSTNMGQEISAWCENNRSQGMNSILFAYSLGKAQRVLGTLLPYYKKDIYCHPSIIELCHCYQAEGVALPSLKCLSEVKNDTLLKGELILAPQSYLKTEEGLRLTRVPFQTAFASGWMAQDHFGYDRGFLISDHADWDDLVKTILESRAPKVYVQHRGQGALVRHLKKLGLQAFPVTSLSKPAPTQLSLL